MYFCNKCKRFVEGDTWECGSPNEKMVNKESSGSDLAFYHEERCEICGSDDLEEATTCEVCGEPSIDRFCDWCMDDAVLTVKHFINMKKGDTLDIINLLSEACDKEWVRISKEREENNERI